MMSGHVVRGSRLLPTYCIGKDILLTINLSVYPSVCLPCLVCPHFFSFHLSVSLCLYPSVCVSLYLSDCSFVCQFVGLGLCLFLCVFVGVYLPFFFCLLISMSVFPSICSLVCLSVTLSVWQFDIGMYRQLSYLCWLVVDMGKHLSRQPIVVSPDYDL